MHVLHYTMAMSANTKAWVCKIVLIGDTNVGNTCIMRRFTENVFSTSFLATIGIDFKLKMVKVNGHVIKVQIWDTAGQEKFRSIPTAYYRGAKGIFLTYDITNLKSFEHVTLWRRNISRWADDDVECVILGNKCDKENERQVLKKDGEKISRKYGLPFLETSAKDDINIDKAFNTMLENIVAKNEDNIRQKNDEKMKMEEIELNPRSAESPDSNTGCCK